MKIAWWIFPWQTLSHETSMTVDTRGYTPHCSHDLTPGGVFLEAGRLETLALLSQTVADGAHYATLVEDDDTSPTSPLEKVSCGWWCLLIDVDNYVDNYIDNYVDIYVDIYVDML